MVELNILKEEPEKKNNLEDIRRLVNGWRILIGVPDEMSKGWNKVYYPRFSKRVTELLTVFGDWETAFDAMQYIHDYMKRNELDCTLDTVVKRTDLYMEVMGKRGLRK